MDFSGRRFSSDCRMGNIHASVVVAGPGERQKRSAGQHPEKYRRHPEYHQHRGINDDDSADLLFTLPLRERVRITRSSQGTPQAEHLPEPKPRLPSSEGDWSHVFQDVTWGESDG